MTKILLFMSLLLGACALPGVPGLGTAPPAPVRHVAQIARAPIDLALNLFDGSLYAFDLAMDLRRPAPGSPEAKRISAIGRKVLAALSVADAAQKAGSSATYEEAFANAAVAYAEFSRLLGVPSTDSADVRGLLGHDDALAVDVTAPRFQSAERASILTRADGNL